MTRFSFFPILAAVMIPAFPVCMEYAASSQASDTSEKKAILILADQADEMPALRKLLEQTDRPVIQAAQKNIETADFHRYSDIVVYIHEPITKPVEGALIDYVEGGGRLLVIHHGLASAKMKNPRWLKLLGIKLAPRTDTEAPWHVSADVTYDVINLAPRHPLTSTGIDYPQRTVYRRQDGGEAELPFFTLEKTEIFHNQRHTDRLVTTTPKPGEKQVLLVYRLTGESATALPAHVPASEETAGWLKPCGRGTVVYLQPGHAASDFAHPLFARLILNAVQRRLSVP